MHIHDLFEQHKRPTFSFEFFPPKSDKGLETLLQTVEQLRPLKPAFIDVTYGAGGSTRQATLELVLKLKEQTGLPTVPHLTCVCHQEPEIRELLEAYAQAGIGNILALGGDIPRDRPGWDRAQDAFRYATDLVAYIQKFNQAGGHPDKRGFGIGVAGFPEGHPATPNRLLEIDHLKAKVDAGADYIVTQLFFDNRDFFDFVERCELAGIRVPILAGLMPVVSRSNMQKMAELAAGSRFPAAMLRRFERFGDDDSIRQAGVEWTTAQSRELIDHGVDGIHYYTLNRADTTLQIFEGLGLAKA